MSDNLHISLRLLLGIIAGFSLIAAMIIVAFTE